jgi:hypothetical protein
VNANVDLAVVQKHTINVLDGALGSSGGLKVNKTVALGDTKIICSDLARKNLTKGREGVMEILVVNGRIKVLDENVASTSATQRRITLGPHNAAGTALDGGVVKLSKSTLTISNVVVVDVSVTKRSLGKDITADTDGSNRTNMVEDLKKHGLRDRGVELTNVKRSVGGNLSRGLTSGGSRLSSLSGLSSGSSRGFSGLLSLVEGEFFEGLLGGRNRSVGGHYDAVGDIN